MRMKLLCAAVAALLAAGGTARADVLALTPGFGGGSYGNPIGLNLGYAFQVTAPIMVTALAYFEDSDPDPMQGTHTVGIWANGGGAPVASASVSAADPVVDFAHNPVPEHFNYHAITPVLLSTGVTYVVSGTPFSTDTFFTADNFVMGAGILFVEGRYGTTAGGYAESVYSPVWAPLGGNFLYELAAAQVPAPGAAGLLAMAAAALFLRGRRRFAR